MLFCISQGDGGGTDFLKNAVTYGQTEGFGSDLWRVDDVSVNYHILTRTVVVKQSLRTLPTVCNLLSTYKGGDLIII